MARYGRGLRDEYDDEDVGRSDVAGSRDEEIEIASVCGCIVEGFFSVVGVVSGGRQL